MAQKQWMDYDSEMRDRLGGMVNLGIPTKTVDNWEWRGAGEGRARRKVGTKSYRDISPYEDNEDWKKVAKNLGFDHEKRSWNDVNMMIDFVNAGRYGGGSSKKEEEEQVATDNPNNSQPEKNEPDVSYNPTSTVVEAQNQETKEPSVATGPSRMDPNNLSRWGGSADRFGFADFEGAMNSGYTKGDINGWLSRIGGDKINTGGDWYRGLQETNSGKVSKLFGGPGSGSVNANWFGRADLLANRKMGLSDYQILSYLDNNLGSLRGNNAKGVAGGIYEELNSMRPVDPKNLLTGGSNLGNAGYADAVKPNRSAASSSTRSSNGTSQFNRTNFGNKKKSGISSIGLSI